MNLWHIIYVCEVNICNFPTRHWVTWLLANCSIYAQFESNWRAAHTLFSKRLHHNAYSKFCFNMKVNNIVTLPKKHRGRPPLALSAKKVRTEALTPSTSAATRQSTSQLRRLASSASPTASQARKSGACKSQAALCTCTHSTTGLNIKAWRELLADYPDVTLVEPLEFGWPIDYTKPTHLPLQRKITQ